MQHLFTDQVHDSVMLRGLSRTNNHLEQQKLTLAGNCAYFRSRLVGKSKRCFFRTQLRCNEFTYIYIWYAQFIHTNIRTLKITETRCRHLSQDSLHRTPHIKKCELSMKFRFHFVHIYIPIKRTFVLYVCKLQFEQIGWRRHMPPCCTCPHFFGPHHWGLG